MDKQVRVLELNTQVSLSQAYCLSPRYLLLSLMTQHDRTNIYGIDRDQEIRSHVSWEVLSGQR